MGKTEKARAPAAGNKSAQLRKEEPNMQSMFLTTITTIALLAGASAAHQKDTTFFAMIGGRCGQVTMPDDMAVHLTALLKTGTCTDKGFTVQQGTEVLPIPTLGDVTLSLYHRPTTTDMPLEDGMLDDTVDTQDDGCKAVSSATGDAGYTDSYRGWYDVQGCGRCNDYCRWVGNTGSRGNPALRLGSRSSAGNPSWWSCALAGTGEQYSSRHQFSSFRFKKCVGRGAETPTSRRRLLQVLETLPSPELPTDMEMVDLGVFGTGESKIEVTIQDCGISGKDPEQNLQTALRKMENPAVLKRELESEGLASPDVQAVILEDMPHVASTKDDSSNSAGIIVGVVVGLLVLGGCVGFGFYLQQK